MIWKDFPKLSENASYSKLALASKAPPPPPPRRNKVDEDVAENTLYFVSQSINKFSDYNISQSVDWECPSLSPYVLLVEPNN